MVDVGRVTVRISTDGRSFDRSFVGYALQSSAFGLFTRTGRSLAEEFIDGMEPIEVSPNSFYPRSRVVLYKLEEEPGMVPVDRL